MPTSARLALALAIAAAALLVVAASTPARAQAWVIPRGEGAVTVVHQFIDSTDHVTRNGTRTAELGRETLHVANGDVVYGVTDRLSVELSLVWLATKWVGRIEDRHGPLDTGAFHASFQDIRGAVRYQLTEGPVAVAPFVAYGGPLTDYEARGHSSFGRRMEEVTAGATVGMAMWRGYWQLGGSYAFVNDINSEDFNLDHVNGDLEAGLMIGGRATVRAFTSGQWMWDGLKVGPQTDHEHLRNDHDRYTQSSFLNVGAGATVTITPRVDLGITVFRTVSARNFHALNALATSLTWRFGGGFRLAPPSAPAGR